MNNEERLNELYQTGEISYMDFIQMMNNPERAMDYLKMEEYDVT